jgi:predicted transcriptional regulator
MSIRRSRFEIYRELLTQVHNGNCQPTRMMYSTELPWPAFNQVMKTLISQEFLVEVKDQLDKHSKCRYMVTENGERFLKYLSKALDSAEMLDEMQFIISS